MGSSPTPRSRGEPAEPSWRRSTSAPRGRSSRSCGRSSTTTLPIRASSSPTSGSDIAGSVGRQRRVIRGVSRRCVRSLGRHAGGSSPRSRGARVQWSPMSRGRSSRSARDAWRGTSRSRQGRGRGPRSRSPSRTHAEYLETFYATLKLGCVPVNVDLGTTRSAPSMRCSITPTPKPSCYCRRPHQGWSRRRRSASRSRGGRCSSRPGDRTSGPYWRAPSSGEWQPADVAARRPDPDLHRRCARPDDRGRRGAVQISAPPFGHRSTPSATEVGDGDRLAGRVPWPTASGSSRPCRR